MSLFMCIQFIFRNRKQTGQMTGLFFYFIDFDV